MEKHTDWMSPADGVIKLHQVCLEGFRIARFNNVHAHSVQHFNRFVDGSMLFLIVSVVKSETSET